MPVPLLDLTRQLKTIEPEVRAAIDSVLASCRFIGGPEVSGLEAEVAAFVGTRHGRGCGCGSDALQLTLWSLGVGPGDEVILPAFTFFATAGAVARHRATPVFVDIDPITYNIDPDAALAAITPRTRALLPVHIFGQCAEIERLQAGLGERSIPIVEDAAQAIGARRHGKGAGSLGDAGTFSFFPSKNLGAMGDGGMVVTDSDELADDIGRRRVHGVTPRKYFHDRLGTNSRLDSLQAAILRVKLRHLAGWNAARADRAARYADLLGQAGLADEFVPPVTAPGNTHIFHQYTLRVRGGRRDALQSFLKARGIGTQVYYPQPLHLQDAFSDLRYTPGSLPVAETAALEVLSLPIQPELTDAEQDEVVDAIAAFARS